MTIKPGDAIPEAKLMRHTATGPQEVSTQELFAGRTVVLFGVPGAFTPTCSAKHLPGYVAHAAALKAKGVDTVACIAVNDVFVMGAWAKSQNADGKVTVLADGNGDFAEALGLSMDGSRFGMGKRAQRFSLLVRDGAVAQVNVEEPGQFKVSSAEHLLGQL